MTLHYALPEKDASALLRTSLSGRGQVRAWGGRGQTRCSWATHILRAHCIRTFLN